MFHKILIWNWYEFCVNINSNSVCWNFYGKCFVFSLVFQRMLSPFGIRLFYFVIIQVLIVYCCCVRLLVTKFHNWFGQNKRNYVHLFSSVLASNLTRAIQVSFCQLLIFVRTFNWNAGVIYHFRAAICLDSTVCVCSNLNTKHFVIWNHVCMCVQVHGKINFMKKNILVALYY